MSNCIVPKCLWVKHYKNYSVEEWHRWLLSFADLPIKDWNDHIGSVLDLYLPNHLSFKSIHHRSRNG